MPDLDEVIQRIRHDMDRRLRERLRGMPPERPADWPVDTLSAPLSAPRADPLDAVEPGQAAGTG
ncbi:hypothetical protein ACFY41_32195 [Streptomyces syringium]|uniref:hypothetical protein n=1 Tax=Streptomyces syringium TaxID=76729 RepID=UPI0036BA419A